MTLSHREAQIVSLVRDYYAATAEWPSDRYLARRLELSRSTVRGHLEALTKKGCLAGPYSPVRLLGSPPNTGARP